MRRMESRTAALVVFLFGVSSLCGVAWGGETLIGRPAIIDGDTLRIRGTVIGLSGVAAPAADQTCEDKSGTVPCGRHSARALTDRIGNAVIACETRGLDASHRTMAICRLGEEDLNGWMVSSGFAVSERFSDHTYFAHETTAWAKRRGLWAGVFEDPTGRPRGDYPLAVKPTTSTADAKEQKAVPGAGMLKVSRLAD